MRVQVRQWGYETFAVYVDGQFAGTESTREDAEHVGEKCCATTELAAADASNRRSDVGQYGCRPGV